jgi:alpha-tubulin suppressor-like RCC1 family protein
MTATVVADEGLAFGRGFRGNTGQGTETGLLVTATPLNTSNLGNRNVTQVAAGTANSLVLTENGAVYSFGENLGGKTGLGLVDGVTTVPTPIDTINLGGLKIAQISTNWHSILLAEDGRVFSFGPNGGGATGLGTAIGETLVATAIDTSNLGDLKITQAVAGNFHNLLLGEDGRAFSFGSNRYGLTGMGTAIGDTLVATPIDTRNLAGLKITQVATGNTHSLVLAENGRVFSFGRNFAGATGLGTLVGDTLVPTPIDTTNLGSLKIKQIAAGGNYSLLLAEDGSLFSMGSNADGQTGLGTTDGFTVVPTPIDMSFLAGQTIAKVSARGPSLLLTEEGNVFSFGANSAAELGRSGSGLVPMLIDTTNLVGKVVTDISAGSNYSLLVAKPGLPVPEPSSSVLVLAVAFGLAWRSSIHRPLL